MNDRETRIITTENGHEVEIKTFLTGRELRDIDQVFLDGMKFESDKDQLGKIDIKGYSGSLLTKKGEKAIEVAIISLDGSPDDIVNRILDLRGKDYNEITKAIDKMIDEEKKGDSD